MVKTFIKAISGFLEYLAEEAINFVLTIFAYIGFVGKIVLEMPVVQTGIIYTQELSLTLLALKIAYEAYMIYILRVQGEPSSDPTALLIGAVRATGVICIMPWLMLYLYGFGMEMSFEIAALPGTGYNDVNNNTFTIILNLLLQAGSAGIFIAVAILFAIIMLIIIVIQSFIRAGELAVQSWTGSFMAMGLTNKQSQSWISWWNDTIALCVTGALQLALIKLSFYCLTPIETVIAGQKVVIPAIINLFLFIAILWVTYKQPTALKDKIASTGVGRVGGSVGQSVANSFLMKKVMGR